MSGDSLNDEEITVDNEEQWREVDKNAVDQDVRSGEQVLVQVIGTASGHVALGHVAVKDKIVALLTVRNTPVQYA